MDGDIDIKALIRDGGLHRTESRLIIVCSFRMPNLHSVMDYGITVA
ncbi:hypothetical protein WSI_01370 [Candidatus Liberibacter asiaticus str. gxpsy]|uniref:Uncharacterized protein n=2 Tax=Liberibacter asiaticus TaxID=34021 RepID=C6XHY7_LIBAP|nr:hypothetical protein CLIBASIA_01460 [Candidatus Liberibacter asiaticus str. psy62]AGH16644.1 hypothetical protein WSI_01370 [Candidatus Liberibacter asiaticus str. gxpsy]BAP26165.1 hypothetical protein CGUJ_01460 [Candidatus Liberibacter asiaticus str. Ishi-1]